MIDPHDFELPNPLSEELVWLLSERMAVVGHVSRIRILDALRRGERNVQRLADGLMTTQQNGSGHLRRLHEGGVLIRRREGRQVFYALNDLTVFEAWERHLAGLRSDGGSPTRYALPD